MLVTICENNLLWPTLIICCLFTWSRSLLSPPLVLSGFTQSAPGFFSIRHSIHLRSSIIPHDEESAYSPSFARAALFCYLLTVVFYFWGFQRLFPNTDPGGIVGHRMGLSLGLVYIGPFLVYFLVTLAGCIRYPLGFLCKYYAWSFSRFGVTRLESNRSARVMLAQQDRGRSRLVLLPKLVPPQLKNEKVSPKTSCASHAL